MEANDLIDAKSHLNDILKMIWVSKVFIDHLKGLERLLANLKLFKGLVLSQN